MFVDPVREPGVLWVESMHELYQLMRRVNESGGMKVLCASWHRPTKVLLAGELERIASMLDGWTSELHESADDTQPPPGR
jgi:hypothetical protein